MKTFNGKFLLLAGCSFLLSCSENETVNTDLATNNFKSANVCAFADDSKLSYSTFFKPTQGWVGDPMPFYDKGKIHVFYLHDARDGQPTFHPWNKITTQNFAAYEDNGVMIPCGDPDGQERALGTGSVFKNGDTYYAFYTAHNGNLDPREKVMLATSKDLNNWTKQIDFVLEAPWGYDRNEFRDPFILKDEATGLFNMLISTRANYKGSWRAVIAKYTSSDLLNWTLDEPFYDDASTFMVECPDIFTMGNYQYLIYSDINDRKVHYKYRSGTSGEWVVPANSALDGISFYAGKTVADDYDRYLVGWAPTRANNSDYFDFDWAGSLISHKLIQHGDGTLGVTFPHGINDNLSTNTSLFEIQSANIISVGNDYQLDASNNQALATFNNVEGTYKISTTIDPLSSSSFGFEFESCGDRHEVYSLVFDYDQKHIRLDRRVTNENPWRIDQVPFEISKEKELQVTIIIENSICVVYVNHEIAFTNRIYAMNGNPWGIFADNGKVEFKNLKLHK